jgi:hypothetical protein
MRRGEEERDRRGGEVVGTREPAGRAPRLPAIACCGRRTDGRREEMEGEERRERILS